MNNLKWVYQGKEIDDTFSPPGGAVGFVYKIVRKSPTIYVTDEKIYIGKKSLSMATKKKVGKRLAAQQLADTGDKRKVKKIIRGTKESAWRLYISSCKPLIEEIKLNPEIFSKEILEFAWNKKQLSYLELKYQFKYEVLERDSYNDNIAGTYYRKDFIVNNQ